MLASTMLRRACVLAAVSAGCGTDATLSSTASLIGKCSFGEIDFMSIQPGEIFLYAAFDPVDDAYAVVTGKARHAESLSVRAAAQELTPVYGATLARNSLEFGDDKWIGIGNTSGEIHITGGETYGTQHVYPSCVFWPDAL
jgi:hypothetical protein